MVRSGPGVPSGRQAGGGGVRLLGWAVPASLEGRGSPGQSACLLRPPEGLPTPVGSAA